jgi:hypothetical protein
MPTERNEHRNPVDRPKRLIPQDIQLDPTSFPDFILLVMRNLEDPYWNAGAWAGVDYQYLDIFVAAVPFAMEPFREGRIALVI